MTTCDKQVQTKLSARTANKWNKVYQCNLLDNFKDQSNLVHLNNSQPINDTILKPPISEETLISSIAWYKRVWFKIMDECNRGLIAWRFLYVDEILDKFRLLVLDRTMDERLANIIYVTSLSGLVDTSYFKFNSGSKREDLLNELRVAGPEVDDYSCDRDLKDMSEQLDELKNILDQLRQGINGNLTLDEQHIHLARVLDTFGRYESASLLGNNKLIGSYTQCTRSTLKLRQAEKFINMRYCWTNLNLNDHLNEQLKLRPRLDHETGDPNLSVGTCLPKSCHTKSLHRHKETIQKLINSQLEFPTTIYMNQSQKVESIFCLVDEDSQFGMGLSGKLCLIFASVWLIACFVATGLRLGESNTSEESQQDKSQQRFETSPNLSQSSSRSSNSSLKILTHLNLRKSWNDFTADKQVARSTTHVELDVLNPIKVFSCIFCVGAHSALLLATASARPVEIAAFVERNFIIQAALVASVVVDTFFVMSAILLTYIILKKLSSGLVFNSRSNQAQHQQDQVISVNQDKRSAQKSSWPKDLITFLVHWLVLAANRYLRLVPLAALMYWFRRDVLTYLGSGPLWDYGFNRETMNGACAQESWTMPFTFMSAFKQLNKQCFVPAWSVSNDIIFSLLLPPIILLLRLRPKWTLYTLFVLIFASIVNSLNDYIDTAPEKRWELGEFRLHGVIMFFTGLSDLYANPIYRASSYLIGTVAGFALFKYDQGQSGANMKDTRWPRWFVSWATYLSVAFIAIHLIISLRAMEIKELIYPYHRFLVALFMILDRPLWAASNSVLFLRMMTDWRLSARMQSWAGQRWRTLAKLNYAILFTHWICIVIQNGILTELPTFSTMHIWTSIVSIYSMAVPAAIFVHVVFENPIDNLIKREIFGR